MVKIMQKSRKLVVAGVICAIALLSTCKNNIIGLGGTVDINPPALNVLTIYPPAGAVIRDVFTLSIEATDDSGVASVTANLTQTGVTEQPDSKYTSFDLKKAADGIHWTAKINTKKDDSSFPLQDGSYKVLLTATDTSGKTVRTESTLTIDNTAPLLILNRPSTTTTDSSADVFGDSFLLVGQVYDDTPVAALTITAKRKGKSEPVFTKSIPNVPQNIRLTVDAFSSNEDKKFYQGLYGTSREAGTKYYEYGITVTDDAKIYQAPGDNGSGTGNTTDRYYLFDDLYSDVLSEHQIQTVYNMMRGTYRSLTEAGTTRSAAQIEADKNKMAAVQAALKKVQLGGDAERKGTFALNPSINPQFDIAGEKPVAKPKSGEPEFSRLYSDSTLTVKVSCNLDGIPLEGADTYRFFLMEWQKFSEFAGDSTYPEDKINSDEIYANPAEKTLKPEFIELTKSKFEKEGSSYIFSVPVSTETVGLTYGKRYVLLVRGKDKGEKNKPGNNLIPASKKDVPSGVYGFTLAKTGKAPEVYVTKINETGGTGADGNITERVYLKKDDSLKFKMKLKQADADVTYILKNAVGGDISETKRYTVDPTTKVGEHEVTIDKAKFKQDADGTYKLTVKAEADEGTSLEQTYTIVYDVNGPVVRIVYPVGNLNGDEGTKLVIQGTAFDTGAGLTDTNPVTVTLTKEGGSDVPVTLAENGENWKSQPINLPEGKYTLTATAKDKLCQEQPVKKLDFTYDKADPVITGLKVGTQEVRNNVQVYTNTPSITVSGTVTESYGIETFKIGGTDAGTSSGSFSKPITLANTEGEKIVTITLKDKAGKDGSQTIKIWMDKTAPQFENIKFSNRPVSHDPGAAPIETSDNPVKITGKIKDIPNNGVVSGIKEVLYTIDGGNTWQQLNGTFDGSDYKLNSFVQIPSGGENTISIKAIDNAGNEAPVFTHKVKIVTAAVVRLHLELLNGTSANDKVTKNAGELYAKGKFKVKISGQADTVPTDSAITGKLKNTETSTETDIKDVLDGWTGHEPRISTAGTPKEYTLASEQPDGKYSITIKASNGQDLSLNFTVDKTEPTINLTKIDEKALATVPEWQVKQTLKFEGTANDTGSGIEKVEAIVNNGTPMRMNGTNSWSGYLTLVDSNNHKVKFRVTDKAGNFKDTPEQTIKVDTGRPTITLTTPANGQALIKDSNYTVKVTTNDVGSGIAKVEYDTTGGFVSMPPLPSATPISGVATINLTGISGNTTYYFRAVDNAGNTSDSVRVTIQKDSTGPTINVISPVGEYISTQKPKFEASITDSNGIKANTAKVHYKNLATSAIEDKDLTENSGSYSFTPSSDLDGNKYEFWFSAEDKVGNRTETTHKTITIDTDNPVLTDIKVNNNQGNTVYVKNGDPDVSITGKATDTNGVAKVEILKGSTVKKTETSIPSSGEWTITLNGAAALANGTHNLTIRATDKAGKIAEVQRTVIVDKTEPTLSVTKLGTASITGNNFTAFSDRYVAESGLLIEGTATDSAAGASGIDFVRYIFNDGTNDIGTPRSLDLNTSGTFSQTIQVPAAAKKLTLICADRAGNKQSIPIALKVDSKAPNQPIITDVNGKGNTPTIIVSGKETAGITIKGTISDDTTGGNGTYSGIKEIRWQLDAASGTATITTSGTPNAWAFTIPQQRIKGGSVIITAIDNVGYTSAPTVVTFLQDTQSPTAKITNFDEHTAQTGDTLVKGTVTDQGTAGVLPEKTKWKIVKRSDGAPTVDNPGGGWTNVNKSTVGTWEITTLPLATYFTETGGSYSSDYTTEISAPSGLFHLPLYLWVEDASENKAVITLTILVDPAGDKPVVTIIAPLSPVDSLMPLSVGGQVAVYGSAKVKTGSVGKVFMDVSTDRNFGSFVSDWHNKEIDGTGSWNTVLNKNNEINNLITGTDRTIIIYYRVWAKNGNSSQKTGGYSAVQKLLFDKGAPVIQAAKFHQDGNTVGVDYKGKEWLTDDDDYLTFSISDDTGIKNIRITTTVNGNPTETTLEGKAQIETYQIGGQNVFTAGTAHGAYSDYTAKFPLKTSALTGTGGEYSITITVTEGTATGTTFLTQTATYTFNFDKEAPGGYIGEYIDAGNSVFSGTTLPSILNNAKVGQYLYVNKQQVKIVEDSTPGTKKLSSAVNGKFDWVLYKDRDYFTESSAIIRGIAYDEGTSGVAKITGSIKQGGTTVTGTEFTVEKDKFRKPIGDFVTWEATVEIPSGTTDGNYTLAYTVEDGNRNKSAALTQTIYIKQKGIHISKVSLGTDLNRSNAVEAGSEEVVPFNESKPQQHDRTFDWSGEIDASSFVFKRNTSTVTTAVIGTITVEYTNGNAPITYTLKKGNTEIKSGTLASSGDIIPLTKAEFTSIGDGDIILDLELRDSCGWKSSEKIKTTVNTLDGVKPKGGVLPLFWNDTGAGKNSAVWNGTTAEGHISYDGYNTTPTAPTPTWTDKPAVSGKIIVSGYVYDETLLKEVTVTANGVDVTATFKNDGTDGWTPGNVPASGLSLNVIKQKLNQTGHYAFWELTWDTSKITGTVGSNIQVSVTAKDSSNTQEAENKIKTIEGNDTTGGTNRRGGLSTDLTIAELDNADADMIKEGQTVRLYSSDSDAYYVYIKTKAAVKVNDAKKKLMLGLSDSVDNTITKYQIYTNTADADTSAKDIKFTTVDVVPYISGLTTSLSKLGGNTPDLYARTALGHYPVRDGEELKVHGFNLTGAACTVGGVSCGTLSADGSSWKLTLPKFISATNKGAVSGKLEANVGTIAAINNTNNNDKPYNKGAKTANNDKLTDDVELDVWQFNSKAAQPERGVITEPVMRINPSNGIIGFAFANGPDYFSMSKGTGNSYTKWHRNYDDFGNVDFVYDSEGTSHGVVAGRDINSSANHAGKFTYVTSKWGPASSLGDGNNYDGANALRLESLGQIGDMNSSGGNILDKTRIQHPSLAATGAGNPRIYLAYYDSLNDQIRFKAGTLTSNYKAGFGQFQDQENTSLIKVYSQSNVSIVAGKYKSGSGEANTGNTTGTYLSLGVVSGANATSDTAVLIWFDETSRMLKYTYKTNPQNGNHASQSGNGNGNWKVPVDVFDKMNVGEHCKIAVDKKGGIHIAAFDSDAADLKYAYLSSYSDTAFKRSTVDSHGITGTHISLDVAYTENGSNGKPVPYIGYYSASAGRSKLAYLVDTATGVSGSAQGTDDSGYFTGKWEISVVPTASRVQQDNINVGVWKGNSATDSGVIKASVPGTSNSDTSNGTVYGNGTANPVLGYAIKQSMNGYIETAQKK